MKPAPLVQVLHAALRAARAARRKSSVLWRGIVAAHQTAHAVRSYPLSPSVARSYVNTAKSERSEELCQHR